MTTDRTYDVVVIGAGAAGENAADYARQHGLSVVIVEQQLVGGECSYWACLPSKALLRPTEVLAHARRVPAAASAVTGEVDVARVLRNRDAFASRWDDAPQVRWLDEVGVDLVRGHARLADERVVEVIQEDGRTTTLTATTGVVVAVGSRAAVPDVAGIASVRTWDNRDVTAMTEVPERLLVLGAGPVGLEMAQAARRLGAREVTVVAAGDRVLTKEEPAAADDVRAGLEADGIVVLTGRDATRVSRAGDDGPVTLTLADGTELEGDELLVAVGRAAPTGDLGLDRVGVEVDARGFVPVDEHLRVLTDGVASRWLYAVGDVNGRALLTHQGKYQGRLVGDRLAGLDTAPAIADTDALPRVVFTDPQLAAVGLTEAAAREAGLDVRVVRYDTGGTSGGALFGRQAGGTALLVIDQTRRVVVGATFVGAAVADLLHSATIAIVGEVPLARLWHAVPSFPTVSEVWLRLLEQDRRLELAG